MEIEHIIVFFQAPSDAGPWTAVERELIPDWLRSEEVIEQMIETRLPCRNATQDEAQQAGERWYKVVEIDRPRPAGQHKARASAARVVQEYSNLRELAPQATKH